MLSLDALTRRSTLVGGTYGSSYPADKVLNPGLSINSFV